MTESIDPLEGVGPVESIGAVEELHALAGAPPAGPPSDLEGRGIVMCAGGPRLITCAWVGLALLRRTLGCTAPIQLWHLGPSELGPREAALFSELDVEVIDALEVRRKHPARTLGGWELKPYAVVHSPFREVVLLDADNLPVRDPMTLLDIPQYAETGALFWPDIVRLSPDNALWELCRVPYRNEPAWESGQAVLDKARCWRALELVLHMNMHSDLFYEHSHGDKDTFHLAWLMAGQPYAMTPHPPRATPWGLVQRDFEGELLFQHRNEEKWVLRGENARPADFRWAQECQAALQELRGRWSGRVEPLSSRTAEDRDLETELAAVRWFDYERLAHDSGPLELLDGHRVGVGRSLQEQHWHVQDGHLMLSGLEGVTVELERAENGFWYGHGLRPPHHEIELRPQREGGLGAVEALALLLLERLADGELAGEEVLVTLATIARVSDLTDVLQRARSRWARDPVLLELIRSVEVGAGIANPSLHPYGVLPGRRYES